MDEEGGVKGKEKYIPSPEGDGMALQPYSTAALYSIARREALGDPAPPAGQGRRDWGHVDRM